MWKLAVDIGGTFTDSVMVNEKTGEVVVAKEPTTTGDASIGFTNTINTLIDQGLEFSQVTQIIHASTLATNTLLERKKEADTCLITTKGFRDVLEIQRQRRYDLFDIFIEKPKPVIPRHYVRELDERISYEGEVIKEMDDEAVRSIIDELAKMGIVSIAISFLHAYANPSHERRVREIIMKTNPNMMVSVSHEVSPHVGEYERSNTTAINAYVMPETKKYLKNLLNGLNRMGFSEDIFIMKSNGGITTVDDMIAFPVHMIEAGPAAGALMGAFYGDHVIHCEELVSFDMGGTTAKLALIEDGRPRITNLFEADKVGLKEGSGLPIVVPAVDLIEIGAGGGSIASVKFGTIKVGPESAGASPGPVCYGAGGEQPTVTDANLVLGYLNPDYFLGGRKKLDAQAAYQAIEKEIAKPLSLDVVKAAWGIHDMVNRNMTAATRIVSIERGKDPRRVPLVVFGGAGPAHGGRIAKELGMSKIFVPMGAGVTSAIGLLVAGLSFDFNRPQMAILENDIVDTVNRLFVEMQKEAQETIERAKISETHTFTRSADLCYVGQGNHLNVAVPDGDLGEKELEEIKKRFNALYREIYGYYDEHQSIEVIRWSLKAFCPPPVLSMKTYPMCGNPDDAIKCRRKVFFPETKGFTNCSVYDRYKLFKGAVIEGPAIIEERESTTVILPEDQGVVDEYGNLMINIKS